MRATILFNPSSGISPTPDGGKQARRLQREFRRHAVRTHLVPLEPRRIEALIEEACKARPDLLVAAGGDGTVNAAAQGALAHDLPLAVVPLGTMNHFARDVGIPRATADAVRVAARGKPRPVDVGEVNGHAFLNNSSIGVYPRLVRERQELRDRHGHGKWMATARAGIGLLRRHPTLEVEIQTHKGRLRRRTPFVFIGNNPYDLNFFALGHRQRLDTGRLSIYYTLRSGRSASLRLAVRSLLGSLDPDKDFAAQTSRRLILRSRRRRLRVAFDGEVRSFEPPLHYRSRPKALRVITRPRRR